MAAPIGNNPNYPGSNYGQPGNSPLYDPEASLYDPNQNFFFGPMGGTDNTNLEDYIRSIVEEIMNTNQQGQEQGQLDPSNFGFNANSKSADTNKRALEELQEMASKLDTADNPFLYQDGKFGKNDMEAALKSDKFSDKEKAVIEYILNVQQNNDPKSTLWNALERDGIVTSDNIKTALSRDLAPDAAPMHDDGLVA